MKNQFKRIGAFILNGFAVNLDRFNQRVQQLLLSTEDEFASELIPPCQTPLSVSSITDGAPVLIWVADTHANCTYFNQTWLDFTGRSLHQELGDGWTEGVHPDDLQCCIDTFLTAFHARCPFSMEYRLRQANGEYRWMLNHGMPQFHDNQELAGYIGTCVDITHLKQAENRLSAKPEEANLWCSRYEEQKLKGSEAFLDSIINAITDPIFVKDEQHRWVLGNAAFCDFVGASNAEFAGKTDYDFFPPDQAQVFWKHDEEVLTTGLENFNEEVGNYARLGLRTVATKKTRFQDSAGNRFIVGYARDITEQKQAEAEIRQSQYQLAAIAAQYQRIVETANEGIWIIDSGNQTSFVNPKMATMLGYTIDEMMGKSIFEFMEEADVAIAHQKVERLQQGITEQHDFKFQHQDGTNVWVLIASSPIMDEAGQYIGALGMITDISDRKRAEFALQEKQQQLHSLLNNIPHIAWLKDHDGRFLAVNEPFAHACGFPLPQLAGLTDLDIWPRHLAEAYRQDDREVMASGQQKRVEEPLLMPEGVERWIETIKTPILNDQGESIGTAGIAMDITERRRAELALQQLNEELECRVQQRTQELARSEQDLRTIFNNVYDAIVIHDMDGTILDCNDRSLELFAATRAQLLVANVANLAAEATQLEIFSAIMQRVEAGETLQLELRARRFSDAAVLEVEVSLRKVTLANRLVTIAGIRDISDRKQAEHQLQAERLRLQLALEAADMGTWESNLETGMWSERTEAIFGYAPGTFPGDRDAFLRLVHVDDQERVFAALAHSFSTRSPYRVEYRINHLDGLQRWVAVNGTVVDNEDGSGRRIVGVALDITERKQAEQALQQLNLELEQRVSDRTLELQQAMEAAEAANQAKSTFLANMSHELRTPLNAILGFAQLMSRDLTLDSQNREQLSIINRSGKHLLNLINDILEMSKIEAGCTVFAPNQFDLYTQIDMLEGMFELRATEKGLQFIIERDPLLPRYIETDENKLRQVLINLLSNAIKFTQQGYVRFRIHTREVGTSSSPWFQYPTPVSSPTSLMLHVEVEDTGVGIDACEVDSLFEPFIQSRNRQLSQEGTGLGLPISRQFVQLMGGELTAQTTLGRGSTFTFAIPVNRVESADVHVSVARPILGLAPTQPPLRILVVEDNDTNRRLLVQLLQSVGFEVRFARDGQQAIAEWETWHPQLIWMDIRMPVMDGYKATRKIRALEQLSSTPPTVIIALTANAFEEERIRVLQVGCDDFMRKPFQDTELLEKMATYLGVQYLYADLDQWSIENPASAEFDAIAALQMLPPALLTQLYQATMELDEQRLAALLEQISPEHPDLIALLLTKLENFDLDYIFQLLQRVSQSD